MKMNKGFLPDFFKKKLNKIDPMHLWVALLASLFFIPALIITIKTASPYVRADDWRFVNLYLQPLFTGDFRISTLWSDPVHPLPVYALLYVLSAKLLNLQIHYIAWFSIFFQLLLGYLILKSVNRSFKHTSAEPVFLITALIGISTYIFSFVGTQAYFWPIMTHCFVGLALVYLAGYYADSYFHKELNHLKKYLLLGFSFLVPTLLFRDWMIIFCAALFTVLGLIIVIDRSKRRQNFLMGLIILVSLLTGYFLMKYFLIEKPRGLHGGDIDLYALLTDHFTMTFKSVAIGQFSGVINFKWLTEKTMFNKNAFLILSVIFMFSYLIVFVVYFYKRLYLKSLLPPAMMLFSLYYLISVLIFRYNPVEYGLFCMVIPRYVMFYQTGIIGFTWGFYLLMAHQERNRKHRIVKKSVVVFATVLLMSIWLVHLRRATHKATIVRSKYPEVSRNIRLKLHDPSVRAWWSNQPGRDISRQLKFLHQHQLNVFAPNYPFLSKDTISKQKE